jgi:uncharacterized iron-regulated membrane protein
LLNDWKQRIRGLLITWVPLVRESGHNIGLGVGSRIEPATGKAFDLDFNQVTLDPVNGDVRGKRMWGEISLSRENLLPFLYKLHYSMHIPNGYGIEFGIWFMGILAIVWALDCFIALSIRFQARALGPNHSVFAGIKGTPSSISTCIAPVEFGYGEFC